MAQFQATSSSRENNVQVNDSSVGENFNNLQPLLPSEGQNVNSNQQVQRIKAFGMKSNVAAAFFEDQSFDHINDSIMVDNKDVNYVESGR